MTALRLSMTGEDRADLEDVEHDPEGERWSRVEHLLAALIDTQRQSLHAFFLANSDGKGKKPTAPEPVPRPGVKPRKRKAAPLSDESAEWLFQMINGGKTA